MTFSTLLRRAAVLASLSFAMTAIAANAAFVGSFGLNGNVPSVIPNLDITSATAFSTVSMTTNGFYTGGFNAGTLPLGTVFTGGTLTLGAATGFVLASSYGTFTQTAAAVVSPVNLVGQNVIESMYVLGTFAGGAAGSNPLSASYLVTFNQNGGPGNSISASATIVIPAATVPEPGSMTLLGLGLFSVGAVARRRLSR